MEDIVSQIWVYLNQDIKKEPFRNDGMVIILLKKQKKVFYFYLFNIFKFHFL